MLAQRWLRPVHAPPSPRRRLVCLPYAGGGATVFHTWQLAPELEICAVQLPGRQDRLDEPPLASVDQAVDAIAGALRGLPRLPVAFYGHSFGGVIAFELARRLAALGEPPIALVVGGCAAPPALPCDPPIAHLARDALLDALHARYGTPMAVLRNEDLMSLALPPLRADLAALERYTHRPGGALGVPITVLRGLRDATAQPDAYAPWQDVTTHPVVRDEIDAGHLFVDSHRAWVQDRVACALAAA
jgi:medium-chain acyl-[acyl-carrier-protein] hydrolase